MAVTWPNIRSFYLDGPLSSQRVTLAGLIPLAQYCFDLEELTVTLNTLDVPSTTPGPKITNISLTVIQTVDVPIAHLKEVAAFFRTFPLYFTCKKAKTLVQVAVQARHEWYVDRSCQVYPKTYRLERVMKSFEIHTE
jgi:hypothetical protein